MRRRTFLAELAAAALAGGAPGAVRWVRAAPAAVPGRTLVVVFLRGGCDGLNVVVPYGEAAYYDARPHIAIAPPAPGDPDAALDLDGFFGLHPALEPLHRLYLEGRLALLPTVHFELAGRSHFANQAELEHAGYAGRGWLNGFLAGAGGAAAGLALGASLPDSLRGPVTVPAFRDPFALAFSGTESIDGWLERALDEAYLPGAAHDPAAQTWSATARLLRDAQARAHTAAPAFAAYPAHGFGHDLATAAAVIRTDPAVSVLTLEFGGWDTHGQQGGARGAQSALLEVLAAGLAAFVDDLAQRRGDVVVLVQTEFGRTLAENDSRGTDHGKASTWMVLGEAVRGGLYLGAAGWPGLASSLLAEGRHLAHTVHYRDVYAELLAGHLGCSDVDAVIGERPQEIAGFV